MAHLTAWLGRVKKFPDLDALIGPAKMPQRATKPKTWEQQLKGWERHLGVAHKR